MLQVVQGEPVSNSSGVYSYGILTWEIITQQVPFSDMMSYELPFRIAQGKVYTTNEGKSSLLKIGFGHPSTTNIFFSLHATHYSNTNIQVMCIVFDSTQIFK